MLSKTIECPSMSLVTHKKRGFALFHLLELFLARFSLLQHVTSCSGSICFLQAMTSRNILICKFTINQLLLLQSGASVITKWGSHTKQGKCYYKIRQLFYIKKWGKWYYKVGQLLQSGTTSSTNWYRHCKAGQLLLQSGGVQQ